MNTYITGQTVKMLRERRGMTQSQLAEQLGVSDKAVSKWETGKGLPDISLIEPLSKALGVSLVELMNGEQIVNNNRASNVLRTKLYVCPVCGNVITGMGDAVISCCGICLPPLEAEEAEGAHALHIQPVEDEHFVTLEHPMAKEHYISFLAFVSSDRVRFVKLYPEGNPEARIRLRGRGILYAYCNRHGLFRKKIG